MVHHVDIVFKANEVTILSFFLFGEILVRWQFWERLPTILRDIVAQNRFIAIAFAIYDNVSIKITADGKFLQRKRSGRATLCSRRKVALAVFADH